MARPSLPVRATLVIILLAAAPRILAQDVEGRGSSAEGDAVRARGRFLRGMAWYELGSAQAAAINAEAVATWNRAVQADYERYLVNRANRRAAKKALGREREQEAEARMVETRRRWRENPTVDDIRSGLALNALAGDLADPAIPLVKWRFARVDLPAHVSIQSLAFRFANAPRSIPSTPMMPSTVAIGRMKVAEKWPVALRRPEFARDRQRYQQAITAVIQTCVAGRPLRAAEVDAVRERLLALREKAAQVAPAGSGLAKQAKVFLDRLDSATKILLDRDFAEELIRDAEAHRARTVGELLAFMKKYRLLFDEADEDPDVWATYEALYNLLKRQKVALDFADVAEEVEAEKAAKKSR